ncbi:meiosis 1 arrest protein [Heterodontus francisci]|uniref:meiosis 1 arrest protein n=1 Tax=Heterodontus francisci TaxID=7792 RepID=UPI00355C30B2
MPPRRRWLLMVEHPLRPMSGAGPRPQPVENLSNVRGQIPARFYSAIRNSLGETKFEHSTKIQKLIKCDFSILVLWFFSCRSGGTIDAIAMNSERSISENRNSFSNKTNSAIAARQPPRILVVDVTPPFWSDICTNLCEALENFFALACSLGGSPRLPLFSLYVVHNQQECLLPFVQVKGNFPRLQSCIAELRSMPKEGCIREKPGSLKHAVEDGLLQFKQYMRHVTVGGSLNSCSVEITVVTSQPGKHVVKQLESGLSETDLVSVRRLQVLHISRCNPVELMDMTWNTQSALSSEEDNSDECSILGTDIDLQTVENDTISLDSFFKSWLHNHGTDKEHLHLLLPAVHLPSSARRRKVDRELRKSPVGYSGTCGCFCKHQHTIGKNLITQNCGYSFNAICKMVVACQVQINYDRTTYRSEDFNKVFAFISDDATYMTKSFKYMLQGVMPNAVQITTCLKCDVQERLISPALLPGPTDFTEKTESLRDLQNTNKATNPGILQHKLQVIKALKSDGVCESVFYGLPLIIRPTNCWKLDWDELETNHQNFHALCHTLKKRDWMLLARSEPQVIGPSWSVHVDSYYAILPSTTLTLLVKPVVVQELLLPCDLPYRSEDPPETALSKIEDILDGLDVESTYNPLSLRSNLYKQLRGTLVRTPYRQQPKQVQRKEQHHPDQPYRQCLVQVSVQKKKRI